jgi:hypothetical protein
MWLSTTPLFRKESLFGKKAALHRRFCGDLGAAKMERVMQKRELTEHLGFRCRPNEKSHPQEYGWLGWFANLFG